MKVFESHTKPVKYGRFGFVGWVAGHLKATVFDEFGMRLKNQLSK